MRRQAIRAEQGQTLILFVFALPLLLALIALVSDGSNLFANKRSVQNVADASVLAAVRELNPCFGTGAVAACSSSVQAVASDYSSRNGGPTPLPACDDSSGPDLNSCYKMPYPGSADYGLQVRIKRDVSLQFGGIINLPSSTVRAKAAAMLGIPGAAGNVAPLPIRQDLFCSGTGHPGYVPAPGTSPPDSCFGLPDITVDFSTPDKSKPMLMDLDIVSTTGPVTSDSVDSNRMKGWIRSGHQGDLPVNAWYAGNSNSGGHAGIATAFNDDGTTPTFIPLYSSRDAAIPPNWYYVVGFASFVIDNVKWNGSTQQLTGHWVRLVDSGVISASGGSLDFGVHAVALNE